MTCKTIEELPDFEGDPKDDVLLDHLIKNRHAAATPEPHSGNLVHVEDKYWSQPHVRKEIVRQIREGTKGLGEVDAQFYDAKNTFAEDALKCFNRHRRPEVCIDYCTHGKVLGQPLEQDTGGEREARMAVEAADRSRPRMYLCFFCPVHSKVRERQFEKKGLYR